MNKTLLSAALIAGFGVAAFAPQAARAAAPVTGGTIAITGTVYASTCSASASGGSAGNGTVVLPDVNSTSLQTAGSSAGWTQFTITLANCATLTSGGATPVSALPTTVYPYFTSTNLDNTSGYLTNGAASNGSNVEVAISNTNQLTGALSLQNGSGNQGVTAQALPSTAGTLTFNFYAGYAVPAGGVAATAGGVSTSLVYTLNYK